MAYRQQLKIPTKTAVSPVGSPPMYKCRFVLDIPQQVCASFSELLLFLTYNNSLFIYDTNSSREMQSVVVSNRWVRVQVCLLLFK